MKKFFRNQKGINLISLTITVLVILILTNIVIYNVRGNLKTQNIKSLQADISNLREKISTYYGQYGEIPANKEYTNTGKIDVISPAVDTGKFYVIDLSALDNLTLNYGMDYEKVKSGEVTDVDTLSDLYIINEDSHNIFYVEGVTLDNQTFYTDYTTSDVDTEAVELKYVDNVKIPDGFYYVGGTKETGLVISDVKGDDLDNSKKGNQFVWIPVENSKDYKRNTNYSNTNIAENATSDTNYLPDGIDDEESAVIDVGGFFVSRFEAGVENGGPVSKKGMAVDSYVTQEKAKTRAKSMINTDSAKSALCSGTQWDLIMKFVDGKDGFSVTQASSDRHNSSGIANTGANEKDMVCNIYDLEGNAFEYVADKSTVDSSSPYIKRGGSYDNTIQASTYTSCNGKEDTSIAFRVVLYVIKNKTWIYQDENGDTAVIPNGFQVSSNSDQNKIANGLVVRGPDNSEFVWVPVPDINNMSQCSTAGGNCKLQLVNGELKCTTHNNTEIIGKLYFSIDNWNDNTITDNADTTYSNASFREPAYLENTEYGDESNNNTIGLTLSAMQEDYKNMATSVAKYGGFYVGRYETSLSDATASSAGTNGTVQSKQGVIPSSANDTGTYTWYGLYDKQNKKYAETNDSIESSMIWGSQYDRIINWVKEGTSQLEQAKLASTGLGNNSSGKLTITGDSNYPYDSINNIKDLGGNLYEWTLEAGDISFRTFRGGRYNSDKDTAQRRSAGVPNNEGAIMEEANDNVGALIGSRMTLYIK